MLTDSIWLNRKRPRLKITMPQRMIDWGPKRSSIQPSKGPMTADSMDCSAAAPESVVLLQPISCDKMAMYKPKDCKSKVPSISWMPKEAPTIRQP